MHWEDRLLEVASNQHGLIGKQHLDAAGLTSSHWWRARRTGRWEQLSPRVLRSFGSAETLEQHALAAVLDAGRGAMLHGPTTLAWFDLPGFDLRDVHVARPRSFGTRGIQLGTLHLLRDVRAHDVTVHRGVCTETVMRAIWSEASRFSDPRRFERGCRRIGRLLDDANVAGLVTWAALHEIVDDIHERGRAGSTILRALAKERPPGSSPTESGNEQRLEELITRAARPPLRRQVVVGGHEPLGRVDFRDPSLPLVVEVNSVIHHSSLSDRDADLARYARFNDAGFVVAVIWEDDLWRFDRAVIAVLDAARAMAEAHDVGILHSPSCPWPDSEGNVVLPVDPRAILPLRG
jgi:very-short-patch-repair endonuclease